MSTERDELLGTLANVICNVSFYPERAQLHILGGDMSSLLDKTTDAVLAAGYRKSRTVATIDELAKLPTGSVILTHKGGVFEKHFDHFREQDNWEARGAGSVWPEDLPATVLYEPL
jgi:hypothetical protein